MVKGFFVEWGGWRGKFLLLVDDGKWWKII